MRLHVLSAISTCSTPQTDSGRPTCNNSFLIHANAATGRYLTGRHRRALRGRTAKRILSDTIVAATTTHTAATNNRGNDANIVLQGRIVPQHSTQNDRADGSK